MRLHPNFNTLGFRIIQVLHKFFGQESHLPAPSPRVYVHQSHSRGLFLHDFQNGWLSGETTNWRRECPGDEVGEYTYDFASYVFSDTTQLLTNSSTVFSRLSLPAWQLIIWSKLHRMLNSGVSIDQRTVVSNRSFLHRASPLMPSFGNISPPLF